MRTDAIAQPLHLSHQRFPTEVLEIAIQISVHPDSPFFLALLPSSFFLRPSSFFLSLYPLVIFVASWTAMFVIELVYKAALADIDAKMAAHVRFLKKYYASGNFLVSGRKIPRDGGIIVAVGKSREQIERIVEEDPFYAYGLADFRIIEFRASQRAADVQKRIEEDR
jgi:uncharacterized protein YciI